MINGRSVLAFVPARGGSKGIKDKNIIDLHGKPLIAYTIEAASECQYVDKVFVSTDSEKIANIAKQCGAYVPFLRSEKLAGDKAETIDAVIEGITELEKRGEKYELLILLQPTSPLRTTQDISNALIKFENRGEEPLVSISKVADHPILMRQITEDDNMIPLLQGNSSVRRQDMSVYYRVNGSIYINRVDELNDQTSFNDNTVPFEMAEEHSIDIDEMKDLAVADYYLSQS